MPAPTPPLFDVTAVCDGSRWRLLVRGELDLRTGSDLVGVATILAASDPPVTEVDLADVSFVDSAGWHAVGGACAVLAERGGDARITAMSPSATRLVDALTSLDALAATSDSYVGAKRARRACRASGHPPAGDVLPALPVDVPPRATGG